MQMKFTKTINSLNLRTQDVELNKLKLLNTSILLSESVNCCRTCTYNFDLKYQRCWRSLPLCQHHHQLPTFVCFAVLDPTQTSLRIERICICPHCANHLHINITNSIIYKPFFLFPHFRSTSDFLYHGTSCAHLYST